MAEVLPLPSPPSSGSSPSRPSSLSCLPPATDSGAISDCDADSVKDARRDEGNGSDSSSSSTAEGGGGDQLSFLALLLTIFRKSWLACKSDRRRLCEVEIGWPSDVRHVAHVTFDRFNGFLGLPVELEPEVPRRAPSASARVFGVSTESMQLSYDSRGNSVPTILLLMQQRLYDEGGLQAEGIFRINAENGQEESVRDQLNRGIVPLGIDVHCLAGLIKAWFRELPRGILDSLPPERVMQCQTEEDCVELVRLLASTEASLLDWAINLMADVAQMEHLNKMNARNIAVVFAPNMTQMADPFTALMYAVQVMNFLKALIERNLRGREDSKVEPPSASDLGPFDENGRESPSKPQAGDDSKDDEETERPLFAEEPNLESSLPSDDNSSSVIQEETCSDSDLLEQLFSDRDETRSVMPAETQFLKENLKGSIALMELKTAKKEPRLTNRIS
ncbi:rho GTPase-activating protein 5 [Punica granatum]|uniref:Rho GTPase-activating protein 5 n=1 Tax=Punica granatum TaxID=22663 RepID=A0A6P8E1R3_PUNGR|nr:rho GTPase-activating protein 5 [Punica granatum]